MNSNIIIRTNKYLLERFPSIWNTKLVWMLLSSFVVHLLFFMAGFLYFRDPVTFQDNWYDSNVLFKSGAALFSVAISILFVVIWLIQLFKNNAFANYYPFGVKKLWLSFWYFLLIFLGCTSFYLSFQLGYKTFINTEYSVNRTDKEFYQARKAAVFLLNSGDNYSLENVRYPSPLDTLERQSFSDISNCHEGPTLYAQGMWHQFYTTKIVQVSKDDPNYQKLVDESLTQSPIEESDDSNESKLPSNFVNLSVVDKVIDVSALVDTSLNFFNYSRNFFNGSNYYEGYTIGDDSEPGALAATSQTPLLKTIYKMLKSDNQAEIKQTLSDFIALCNTYKVRKSLTSEKWFKIIHKPPYFRVTELIRSTPKDRYEDNDNINSSNVVDFEAIDAASTSEDEEYYNMNFNLLDDYIDAPTLNNSLESVVELRPFSKMEFSLYLALWVAFGFSTLLFTFRVTGLKSLIFSAVSIGLIGIFTGLIALFGFNGNSGSGIAYFILFIYLVIFFASLGGASFVSKAKHAVLLNLSIIGFVPALTLLLFNIDSAQKDYFERQYGYNYKSVLHPSLLDTLGNSLNIVLFLAGILFIFLYSRKIRSWKALPEG